MPTTITPTVGHYYLVITNGQSPATWFLSSQYTGVNGIVYYHVSINGGALSWYNTAVLPDGFAIEVDFGTTMPTS